MLKIQMSVLPYINTVFFLLGGSTLNSKLLLLVNFSDVLANNVEIKTMYSRLVLWNPGTCSCKIYLNFLKKSCILNDFLKNALQIKSLFLQFCILKASAALILSCNLEPFLAAGGEGGQYYQ